MKAKFQSMIEAIQEEPKRVVYLLMFGFILFWILRGCNPGKGLPSEVLENIDRKYITCISPDDTPIQPGFDRQPECGKVYIEMIKEGVVPGPDQAVGVTRAICYRITVESPSLANDEADTPRSALVIAQLQQSSNPAKWEMANFSRRG